MKNLLEKDFIEYHNLAGNPVVDIVSTNDKNFDLKDDDTLVYPFGNGVAKYKNPNKKTIYVINYEKFFKSLPQPFQQNRHNCDLIVYTSDSSHFLLNELTNTNPEYINDFAQKDGTPRTGKINVARLQFRQTLEVISDSPTIRSFFNKYATKQCCFFNKQIHAPIGDIIATKAFNRLSTLNDSSGHKMSDPNIESYGFELWEFSGNQVYLFS